MVNRDDLIREAIENGMDENEARAKVDALIESIEAQGEDISIMDSAKAWLNNLTTTVNSIVENPAQPSNWTLFKSADSDLKVKRLVFKEEFNERQIAFAPALVPGVIDKQGDIIDPITIEETAWKFLEEFREVDTDHNLKLGQGIVVESWVSKVEEEYDRPDGKSETYPEGTWMLGIKVPEKELWEKMKRGEYEGFSIFGEGDGIELQKDIEHEDIEEMMGVLGGHFRAMFDSITDAYRGAEDDEEFAPMLDSILDSTTEDIRETLEGDDEVEQGKELSQPLKKLSKTDKYNKGKRQYKDEDIMTEDENEDEEVVEEQEKEATNGQILSAINDLKDTMKELLTRDDCDDDDEEKAEELEEEEVDEEPEKMSLTDIDPEEKMKFADDIRKSLMDTNTPEVKDPDYEGAADKTEKAVTERDEDE